MACLHNVMQAALQGVSSGVVASFIAKRYMIAFIGQYYCTLLQPLSVALALNETAPEAVFSLGCFCIPPVLCTSCS